MNAVTHAGRMVGAGGLVAFPTETVYGLGADAFNERAVARIFSVKKRPRFDPLIVHIASPDQLALVTTGVPDTAKRLIEAFWPGPLTVIVEKSPKVPELVTAGLRGVGVRMPGNQIARDLIAAAQTPIAAPSANSFGGVSPTCADHVRADLGEHVDAIIDGGSCTVGIESTIISCMGPEPVLLRPGGIALEDIEKHVGPVDVPDQNEYKHASPGRIGRHYAPHTPVTLVDACRCPPVGKRTGLLSLRETGIEGAFYRVETLSRSGDLSEAACNLFSALKSLDAPGVDSIMAVRVPNTGLGRAINDRLMRAAKKHDSRVDV
ncbi:MAG: threonylcarbamoyl-AMP synthase [Chitinivibrionales bacterium]|nr:threonylcarbamoyl-AMP synthase [Chitinivibrionales bacterium]MBD3357925.1 threonylcarbamoyl-AMP synthase [Chitinivibrionales bacterium]